MNTFPASDRTRIKICCIADVGEMFTAASAGVDVVGLVSAMPSGPGPIDEYTIASVASVTPPGVSTFLLTSLLDPDAIIEQHRRCRTTAIQLVDSPASDRLPLDTPRLRLAMPGIGLVRVVHVRSEASIEEAMIASADADAVLLDSGNPTLAVKELGGTGRVHDWSISRRIVEEIDVPVYLAGGLTPANVGEAIARVRPFGVDVCSGVRTDGKLDRAKLEAFIAAVRAADARRAA